MCANYLIYSRLLCKQLFMSLKTNKQLCQFQLIEQRLDYRTKSENVTVLLRVTLEPFNSFTAKLKIVVWDYFLIQYYT